MTVDPKLAKQIVAATARRRKGEAQVRRFIAEQERLIMQALEGSPVRGRLREVAKLADVSHTAILKIKKRTQDD